ncbi:two-component response regulator 24-like [Camellia sinensis]|uniref:two-component response regulator 24-like n=1 Tax=Camellia sinensis TaxID=4442 RepID=UPI0010364B0C|nr:two-component response regulator 24-like [Camellia sinensis]
MGSSSSKSVNKSGNMRIDGTNSNFTAGKRLCVLIVDDDPVSQRIHSVLLRRFGLETQVVGNGKEAADLYRSRASFHLVLENANHGWSKDLYFHCSSRHLEVDKRNKHQLQIIIVHNMGMKIEKFIILIDSSWATRELRAMGVNSMIVGMTSRDQDSEKLAFMAAGLDDCHAKPLTVDTITSLLQELNKKH